MDYLSDRFFVDGYLIGANDGSDSWIDADGF